MKSRPTYLHLPTDTVPPDTGNPKPYRAIVVIESQVSPDWQWQVSRWLVDSGCLYMMAWGMDCSKWDDSVDIANLANFNHGEVPEDAFIMTTWHEDESLSEVFWFAQTCANHDCVRIEHSLIVHIAAEAREAEMLGLWNKTLIATSSSD